MQFVTQQISVCPHLAGKSVIFTITEGNGTGTLAMGRKSETNAISIDLDPDVATSVAGAPFE